MWIAADTPHDMRYRQLQAFAEELVQAYRIGLTILWGTGDEHTPHLLLWQCPQGMWQVKQGDDEAIASWLHTLGAQLRAARRKHNFRHERYATTRSALSRTRAQGDVTIATSSQSCDGQEDEGERQGHPPDGQTSDR